MPALVTVCIPIAPYHTHIVARAIKSVQDQTIDAHYECAIDTESRGAGFTRNRLLERVNTPYVVFLDADDWLEPTFLEDCFKLINFNHYVYTDWFEGATIHGTMPGNLRNGEAHLITSLLHTDMVRSVGAFDEKLRGMEDTDLYLKLMMHGYCGVRVNSPLVHYTPDGQRSQSIMVSGEVKSLTELLKGKYNIMGCCGQDQPPATKVIGERQEGDVKAMYIKREPGRVGSVVTSRFYGYLYPQWQTWVDPRDIQRQPNVWREVKDYPKPSPKPKTIAPILDGLEALAQQMINAGVLIDNQPVQLPEIVASPDYKTVYELARQAYD